MITKERRDEIAAYANAQALKDTHLSPFSKPEDLKRFSDRMMEIICEEVEKECYKEFMSGARDRTAKP